MASVETGDSFVPGTPTELFPGAPFLGGANTGIVFSVAPGDQRFLLAAVAEVEFGQVSDGDRFIAVQRFGALPATGDAGDGPAERTFVVTNWFEELRERMGGN